ncbi:MAG: T9SS type A sorting domain-containing protein [Saprospiraceae bacterium]|nr:T9SS type A sorting domain-containing protein [Saprospiraceae bacterium]
MKAKNKAAFVIALVVASLFFNPFIFGRSLKHADLILNCPANQTEAACQTQSSIDAKFSNWLSTVSFTGGCNVNLSNNNSGAPPACGGVVVVTYTATSTCDPTVTCSAVFSVTAAPPVVLVCPMSQVEASCQTQVAIDTLFAIWLRTVSFSGGCNAALSNDNNGAPSFCGGIKTVWFTLTSDCEPPKTCNATFSVTDAPPVILNCPMDREEAAGQTQSAIDAKFSAWLASANFSGGCNPIFSNNNSGAPPNTGGSTDVSFEVKSSCESPKTCTANFTVKFPNDLEDVGIIQAVRIAPNPVTDFGYILFKINQPAVAHIELLNASGQIIWKSIWSNSTDKIPIDFRTYATGIYYLKITVGNSVRYYRWMHI